MAPANVPYYQKDEKVLCFHHELLYEAKVLDHKHVDENDKKSPYQYRVHYKGWKNTWDDWVPQDRIRKNSEENKELATNLKLEMDKLLKPAKATAPSSKKKAAGSDLSSARGSEERQTPAMGRGQKRGRDFDIEKENDFNQRPAIHVHVPDVLKSLLVDDWEFVTKNLMLVPLPSKVPVNTIVDIYHEEQKQQRQPGSPEAHLLEEVVSGVKEYFKVSLGKILLYRFERQQYLEVRQNMDANKGEWKDKLIGDIYGAEHFGRLLVSVPEMVAQTNMDQQSVEKLRIELTMLTKWFAKNTARFFVSEYETTTAEYVEKIRGN